MHTHNHHQKHLTPAGNHSMVTRAAVVARIEGIDT